VPKYTVMSLRNSFTISWEIDKLLSMSRSPSMSHIRSTDLSKGMCDYLIIHYDGS